MTRKQTYTTIADVIDYEIKPSLGEFVGDYDLQGIADEIYEYVVDGLSGYFVQREDIDENNYWDIVEKYDISEDE